MVMLELVGRPPYELTETVERALAEPPLRAHEKELKLVVTAVERTGYE
jgi:hypothetical protein